MTLVDGSASGNWDGDEGLYLHQIEEACLRFDAAWEENQQPKLAEYLSGLTGEARRHALCDLLWIEWKHRRRLGATPNLEDYRSQFKELSETVDEAWRSDFGRLATENETTHVRGGRYTVLRSHACGGLGQLYVAHDGELDRPVALKEIKRRQATRQIAQERFLREARITGQLEHPGIVPVYSLGTNPDGTPYYTMRFIQGESLRVAISALHSANRVDRGKRTPASGTVQLSTSFVPANGSPSVSAEPVVDNLGTSESSATRAARGRPTATRADMFASHEFRRLLSQFVYVCRVVDYAHSRGVVHRDLKPSNIMLGKYDEVFVVDWGLAKEATQPELCGPSGKDLAMLTDMSFTTDGALVGTTAYMSPEQAGGKACELPTAIDIYCLGATLYHLLVGEAPLAGISLEERLTRIQRGEIPTARSLQAAVPAALDAICANAMSLDPADRYASAAELAKDLEHWLEDKAVTVFTEPLPAQVARWGRRHQTFTISAAIATALAAVSLAGTTGLVMFKNRQLATARADAENKRLAAEQQRDQSQAIAAFMVKCFRSPDPEVDGTTMTIAEILDRSFEDLRDDSTVAPSTKSRLFEALIQTNLGLGFHANAVSIAEYAWKDGQKHLEIDQEQLLSLQSTLAAAYLDDGQIAKAVGTSEAVVAKSLEILGSAHPLTLGRQSGLASAYGQSGRLKEALQLAQQTFITAHRVLGAKEAVTVQAEYALAVILREYGRFQDAIAIYQKVLEQERRDHGPDHPKTLMCQNALAEAYEKAGRFKEAISLQETTLSQRRQKLGPEHPFTLNSQNNLAMAYQSAGRFEEAIDLHKKTLELRQAKMGTHHPSTLTSINNLATAYADAGRFVEAIPLFRQACEARKQHLGEDHPDTLRVNRNLSAAMLRQGLSKDSLLLIEQQVPRLERILGKTHPHFLLAQCNLALALRTTGHAESAITMYQQVLPQLITSLGPSHVETLNAQHSLATALATTARSKEAVKLYEQTHSQQKQALGDVHPNTLQSQVNLSLCLMSLGEHNRALSLLESASYSISHALGWAHPLTLQCYLGLANAYDRCHHDAKSANTYDLLQKECNRHLGPTHLHTIEVQRYFAGYLFRKGAVSEGISQMEAAVASLRERFGRHHQKTIEGIDDLAKALRLDSRYSDAEAHYVELLATADEQQRTDNDAYATNLYWLGLCRLQQNNYADATSAFNKCWELRRRLSPDDWRTPLTQNILGHSLAGQKQYADAERHLVAGYDGVHSAVDKIPAADRDAIVQRIVERIVLLYEAWGKPVQANDWRSKLHVSPAEPLSDVKQEPVTSSK